MLFVNFILPIVIGFYLIYKAISSLDKVDRVKKNGIRTRAKVLKIRKEKSDNYNDDEETAYLINNSEINYYLTVKFKDKKGREFEKELEFPTTKVPNRNLPFDTDVIYFVNDSKNLDVILENNKGRNSTFYFILIIGIIFLFAAAYNYDG